MKVLQVTESFAPMWEYGGVARVSYDISQELRKKGYQLTVFTINRNPTYNISENTLTKTDGLDVIYFGMLRNKLLNKLCVFPSLKSVKTIKQSINDYDIIHIHDYRSILTVLAVHYARKNHVPYILQAHGALPKETKGIFKEVFDRLFGYKILRDAKALVALSNTEKDYYLEMGCDKVKVHIIPNGIGDDFFPVPEKGKFRKKYGLSSDVKIITFVGRLDPSKNVGMLIQAFADLYRSDNNLRLALVGKALNEEYGTELERLIANGGISDAVIQTGYVTSEEKKEALVDSDVFVTPSYSGFPITFVEACACQIPIVTTTKGDDLGWIDGQVGYVAEFSVEGVAKGIVESLNHGKREEFMETEMRIISGFMWCEIIMRYTSLYFQ